MKNQFKLDVKAPCLENFNEFSPTKNGGFCNACKKEVIDFTKMNAQEIISYFQTKKASSTCGKFHTSQLVTYEVNKPMSKKFSLISGLGLAILSLFSFGNANAQQDNNSNIVIKTPLEIQQEATITVKGVVTEDKMPLPGANVVLEGTTIGVATDLEGRFVFPKKLKKGDVLVISYVGMESKKIVVSSENNELDLSLNANLEMEPCVIVGKVAVKKIFKSKSKK